MNNRWEYMSVYGGYTGFDMKKYGAEGWELVTVCLERGGDHRPTFYFKRPLRDTP